MSDTTQGSGLPQNPSFALDESVPGQKQTVLFWICFTIAWGSIGIGQGVAAVAVPQLLREWDPNSASANLSVVLTVAGFATLVFTPIFGRLSDRSRSRMGLRRPWVLYGSLIALAGYLCFAFASNPAMLWLGTSLNTVGWGAVAMAQHALFADQIRRRIRAIMSAVTGASGSVGVLVGTLVTGSLATSGQVAMFLVPGLIGVALSMTLFFTLKDLHRSEPAPRFDVKELVGTFWLNPRRYPDFAWAWFCRFFMTASIVTITSYLYLTIVGRFGITDAAGVAAVQSQATLAFTAANIVFAFIFGVISDKTKRRKPSVIFGAFFSAIGLLVSISVPSIPVFIIGLVMVGAGQGAYISADVALMTEVLPSKDDAGKDLGIVALAYLLPGIFVPVLGLFLTRIGSPTGENFGALYVAAFVLALLAAFTVSRIKSVR